jgi:Protein of unknown function (DUF2589)/Domain of unknown function (DUF4332)
MKPQPLANLLAVPLQSAVRAQALAAREMLSFVQQIGMEGNTVRTFKLRTSRVIEETRLNPQTGRPETQLVERPLEISVPLLTMVPMPNMLLSEMNVEFGLDIIEPRSETLEFAGTSPEPATSLASSLAVFTPLAQSASTTMKVNMKLVQQAPEGLAKLGDVLVDLVSAQPVSPTGVPRVRDIPGIAPEQAEALRAQNIATAEDLTAIAANPEALRALAAAIGVSEQRIRVWIEEAKALMEERKSKGAI